jgi:tRNA(Arg) A34 adenosine deaminase TadA
MITAQTLESKNRTTSSSMNVLYNKSNNDIGSRHHKHLSSAMQEAYKSDIFRRHGCVITKGGKVIGRGYNEKRTQSRDNLIKGGCTCHAEVAAVRDCMRTSRRYRRFKKCKLSCPLEPS